MNRSAAAVVRNPLLALPSVQALSALPPASRAAVRAVLVELRRESLARAEKAWRAHKAPMACYWKASGVYAGHLARSLR